MMIKWILCKALRTVPAPHGMWCVCLNLIKHLLPPHPHPNKSCTVRCGLPFVSKETALRLQSEVGMVACGCVVPLALLFLRCQCFSLCSRPMWTSFSGTSSFVGFQEHPWLTIGFWSSSTSFSHLPLPSSTVFWKKTCLQRPSCSCLNFTRVARNQRWVRKPRRLEQCTSVVKVGIFQAAQLQYCGTCRTIQNYSNQLVISDFC